MLTNDQDSQWLEEPTFFEEWAVPVFTLND